MNSRIHATRLGSRLFALLFCGLAGCAGPGPKLFPPTPVAEHRLPDGRVERGYDTDRDGRPDYRELLSNEGRIVLLRFDLDRDGELDLEVDRTALSGDDVRHLVILLDSVPYAMVRRLWDQGRFRYFDRPSRVISPFPVMTDLCFADFFGVTPCIGVEAEYYDGHVLRGGFARYADGENSPWLTFTDYHMSFFAHGLAYFDSLAWYGHELRRIQDQFGRRGHGDFVGYCVGTSALGAQLGPNGHWAGLVRLDSFCRQIMHQTRGRVQITLMSDHGHNNERGVRISIRHALTDLGYRVTQRLVEPSDVVVPTFGMVTFAAVHTTFPQRVAGDLVGVEGVDLTCYLDGSDRVVVVSSTGRARISKSPAGYRYEAEFGDPLRLGAILNKLAAQNQVDADGFVGDRVLFEATADHRYPDGVHRLWRAFHGVTEHTPDVLVSITDGWYAGSGFMSRMLDLAAAHGNLETLSSNAFVMTTAGRLPPVLRMEDLRGALRDVGVRVAGADDSGVLPVGTLPPVLGHRVVEQREEPILVD